jgi:hypothetical protein
VALALEDIRPRPARPDGGAMSIAIGVLVIGLYVLVLLWAAR